MEVTVRLTPGLLPAPGATTIRLNLDEGAVVADLHRALCSSHPHLAAVLPTCVTLVDGRQAGADAPLRPGVTVAVLRPIAGGQPAR
ncbi:MAG TPA: MoaD/ThiS family protein [Bacillota bacterium]